MDNAPAVNRVPKGVAMKPLLDVIVILDALDKEGSLPPPRRSSIKRRRR